MIPIYTNDTLLEERELVKSYLRRKGGHKNYPNAYYQKVNPLIDHMYSLHTVTPNIQLLNDPLVIAAYEFALEAHSLQERKYTHSPYIVHPMEMASRLSEVPNISKHEIAAALLHDVVEDCGITAQEIKSRFGETVAQHLHYLTDHVKEGNRRERTEANFNHLKLSPDSTKNIKIADNLSNARSIIICDPNFSATFLPVLNEMTQYFESIKEDISIDLVNNLNQTIEIGYQISGVQKEFSILKLDKKVTKSNKMVLK